MSEVAPPRVAGAADPSPDSLRTNPFLQPAPPPPPPPPPPAVLRGAAVRKRLVLDDSNPLVAAPAPAAPGPEGRAPDGGDRAGRAADATQSGERAAPRETSLQAGDGRAAAVPDPAEAAYANPFAATPPVGSEGGASLRASANAGGTREAGWGDSPPGAAPPGALPATARDAFSNPFAAALPPIKVPRLRPAAGGARPGSGGSGGSSGGSGPADPCSGGRDSEGPPVRAGAPGVPGVARRQGTSAEQLGPAPDMNMGSGRMRPSASAPLGGAAALLLGGRAAAPSPSKPPLAVRPRSAEAPALRASSSLPRGVSRDALAAAAGAAGGGGARGGGGAAGGAGAGGLRIRTAAGGEREPEAAGRGGAPGGDGGPAAAKAGGAVRGWADLDQGTSAASQDREAASAAPVMSETPLTVTFMSQARGGRVPPARKLRVRLTARSGGSGMPPVHGLMRPRLLRPAAQHRLCNLPSPFRALSRPWRNR